MRETARSPRTRLAAGLIAAAGALAAGSERPAARYSLAGIHALRRETAEIG